ncbi:Nn.00g024260.m01.CDS01 [Neocucurbitaria sp. VM-36]
MSSHNESSTSSANITALGHVDTLEDATLRAGDTETNTQPEPESLHVQNAREERAAWDQRHANAQNQISELQRQCTLLAHENALLKVQAANKERVDEYRKREKKLIEQIEGKADERVKRAEAEKESALKQVEALQNSSTLSKAILEQNEIIKQELVEKANRAEERARVADEAKQTADIMERHLWDMHDALENDKRVAETKIDDLTSDLNTANATISLLKEQKQKLEDTIQEYGKKEEGWRADRIFTDRIAETVKEMKKSLTHAVTRATEYRAELERVKAQRDAEWAVLDEALYED